ncbi:TIGR03089 family protein [Janibacter anophelis]|uniref:TIGR03089 family protein n=1 Tax=Janibacter anophelis TaxID=319054 RepID=UPI00082D0932|nr:TIGR03089 family protein [Janibacter anophelis]
MPTPAEVLATLNQTDSAAPRITCYDDLPGPTAGERIELSGRVLGTWVSKAANALQEEWDVEPGSVVHVAIRPHWRLLYWAWAVWSVGAVLDLDDARSADLVVTDDAERLPADGPAVLVTRAALARSAGIELPDGVMDEAADLASYGDLFTPWAEPEEGDVALRVAGETASYGAVVATTTTTDRGARVQLVDPSAESLLRAAMSVWAAGGSLVVHLGPTDEATVARRADAEGVTA